MEVKLFGDKLRNEPPSVPSGPTLLSTSKATLISHTLASFIERFQEQSFIGEVLLETLHAMDNEMCKIYVFGSFSLNCFVKLNPKPSDIDLLIVGKNVLQMANAFATFISQFGEATHMIKPGLMQITLKDSQSSRSFKIQVVLRYYKSLTEAASEIDFPVTAVFFDGKNIFFNEETRRQLVAQRIEVVPERFSYSSFSRLLKYKTRGFSITFPGLHINAFETGNPVRLFNDTLHINYFKIHGLLVSGTMKLVNYKKANYDDDLPRNAPFFNAVNLGSKLILYSMPGEDCIDLSKIKKFEDAVPKHQFDIQKMNVVHSVCKVKNGDLTVNISILKHFFDMHDTLHFVQMYMEHDIQTVSKYLLDKMEEKYQQLCGTNIEFLHMEPLSAKITNASFYGNLPRCGKRQKNSKFLQVETLTGLVNMMFHEEESKLATCGICQNTIYQDDANVLTMKCGHKHHFSEFSKCQGLETWLENKRTCPLCRHEQ
jgi:hypothetical protein